jgi:AcrR family transcriptional regulator
MKCEAEIKEQLISNAIRLIAEGGFEKATTKELTYCSGHLQNIKMNEVYIYRLFGSKERLYGAAFRKLDLELFRGFKNGVEKIGGFESATKERFFELFSLAWKFILRDEECCRCYVRYYYSIYFKGDSLEAHKKLFCEMIAEMSLLFKEEADAASILHSVFTAMLDFAIRVYNGELKDNEKNRVHVFNILYCMMMMYFKDPVKTV